VGGGGDGLQNCSRFFPKKKRKLPPIFLERGPWEDRGPGQKKGKNRHGARGRGTVGAESVAT
jgi:hypothetical protein